MKKILMIAYHFPPLAGSSGIQRTLRFVQHLPDLGWQPVVLTASVNAYERTSADLMNDLPEGTVLRRAFALDAARHLQIWGRHFAWTARPDRWISWKFFAVRQGLKLIKRFKPALIWSTYPIATAHIIALALHRKTGIPWIADFRDPMAHEGFPADPLTWQRFAEIEAAAMRNARFCVFTTQGAARMYRERYPDFAHKVVVLENGYDEASFRAALSEPPALKPAELSQSTARKPLILLHSGIVYASERDPTQLFTVLGRLLVEGLLSPADLRVRFRAAVHEKLILDLAERCGAQDFIELCPPLPYGQALAEMMSVDALLVLQASNCNAQIPAKIYEYLRAGRPILGLTDPAGDTASVLHQAGLRDIARLDSEDEITAILPAFLTACRQGSAQLPLASAVQQASRQGRSEALAALLNRACSLPDWKTK